MTTNNNSNPREDLYTPFDIQLEEAVVGTCEIESQAIGQIIDVLKPEMFYGTKTQIIFTAICRMFREHRAIDLLTVKNELQKEGTLEEAGGPVALAIMSSRVASSAHLVNHALVVKELYMRREMRDRMYRLQANAVDMTMDISDTLVEMHNLLDRLEGVAGFGSNMRDMPQLMEATVKEALRRKKDSENGITGIPTGLTVLNGMTNGLQKGELTILAARPSVGKSSVMLHFAMAAGLAGKTAMIFSLEMKDVQLGDKMIYSHSDIAPSRWKAGLINQSEAEEAAATIEKLNPMKIYVDDNPDVSMEYLRACIRSKMSKGGCDVVFIDYVQIMNTRSAERNRTREQEISQVSRKAKLLAKEFNIAVVLLSQLNRNSESMKVRPEMSQLRESGSIEQDADVVLLLYRPAMFGLEEEPRSHYPTEGLGVLIVAKNRNGATGDVYFRHNPEMTKIIDYV